ncbi:hypothetical protein [uncultured Prevotella sp.]|uniref:hypothetical protein n=1 Tax=uncultured Prevotella sp. TaxID=159272 RepID=UPI0027E30C77|nr:hypothetical protein [uncultured Prevotella sp.]
MKSMLKELTSRSNGWGDVKGYCPTLMGSYLEWHPKRNRRMRNRMYGGVRGR